MNSSHTPTLRTEQWAKLFLVIWGTIIMGPHVVAAGPYSVDLAELTLCAWSGGVPHSPGYPLWTRLAQAAIGLQGSTDPFLSLGRFGVVLAILAAVMTQDLLRKMGANIWAATGCAGLLMVVPQCIRAFSITEVYALDLMLLAMTFWACDRGDRKKHNGWTALGITAAILAIGHRPINVVLILAIAIAWPNWRRNSRGIGAGMAIGVTLQAILYWDLWLRIQNTDPVWIDEHVQATLESFVRFVGGLPFEQYLVWSDDPLQGHFDPMSLGAQCLALISAALLIPLFTKGSRLAWGLWGMALWHLAFMLVFRVSDRDFFVFPILWVGVVSLALSTRFISVPKQGHLGTAVLVGVVGLSAINKARLPVIGHDQWREPLRETLQTLPAESVILTDDWPVRSGLIALREMEGIGSTISVVRISLEGGDIQRLAEWFEEKIPLLLLEERDEIDEIRPVRVHDSRLLPLLIEQGLVTTPAESGTWSVRLAEEDNP